jgi:hypothetical protein
VFASFFSVLLLGLTFILHHHDGMLQPQQEARQSKNMIPMQMGDKDAFNMTRFGPRKSQLPLDPFSRIKQKTASAQPKQSGRRRPMARGNAGARAKKAKAHAGVSGIIVMIFLIVPR